MGEDRITLFRNEGPVTPPLLTEIDHVAIAVHDLEAAIAYYARDLRRHGRPP